MPGARRAKKGQTGSKPDAQIRKGEGTGPGPDRYDGRSNLRGPQGAETPTPNTPGPARVVKTY